MGRPSKPWFWGSRDEWYVTIKGKRHRLGSDKDEAQRQFHEILARKPEETIPSGSVAEVIEHFMNWVQQNRAPRTYKWYQENLGQFYAKIKNKRTVDLKPYHIQQILDAHPKWSDGYKAGLVTAVKRVFNWGAEQGYVFHSPLRGLRKPRAIPRDQILSPEEFKEVLSHIQNPQFRDLTQFVWFTGCRPQEAVRVEARHLDGENGRLIIPLREAKGRTKPRIIYLAAAALEIFERNARTYPKGPVFRNTQGRPWKSDSIGCTFGRIAKKTGVRYCLYALRHSYATHRLQEGCDPVTLANLLGHADVAMLARVYANVAQDVEYMRKQAARNGH